MKLNHIKYLKNRILGERDENKNDQSIISSQLKMSKLNKFYFTGPCKILHCLKAVLLLFSYIYFIVNITFKINYIGNINITQLQLILYNLCTSCVQNNVKFSTEKIGNSDYLWLFSTNHWILILHHTLCGNIC